jgi:hypothetical protein
VTVQAPQAQDRSTPCPVAGTWILTGATEATLIATGQAGYSLELARGWVHEGPSAPAAPFAAAAGVHLEISPDGAFAETVDSAPPIDWWELDGTLLAAPAPTSGRVIAEPAALYLVPRTGIGRVSYGVDGVLHGADATAVSDRLELRADGALLRMVSVSVDSGETLGRSWYRYERAQGDPTSAQVPASAVAPEPRELRDFPALEDGLRLEVPRDLADEILADHERAEQLNREHTEAWERRVPGSDPWTPADGIADLRLLGLDGLAPQSMRELSGRGVRMSDGKALNDVPPSTDEDSEKGVPASERSVLPVLRDRLAPLLAKSLPRPGRPRTQVGSLLIADPARREVRWVLFLGIAAVQWREALIDGFPYRPCLGLARELRDLERDGFHQRVQALPASLLDRSVSRADPDVLLELATALAAPSDESHLRDPFAETEADEDGSESDDPALPSLWNAVRIDLPADRAAIIRDQQLEAMRREAERALTAHVERGVRFRSPEDRGLATLLSFGIVRRDGDVRRGGQSGFAHRLRDGRGVDTSSDRQRPGRSVPPGWPRPGQFDDFVLEYEVMPALGAVVLEPADGSVATVGSLMVTDLHTGEVRWVLFLGEAARLWERAERTVSLDEARLDLARELQAMSAQEFETRIPLLPITLRDALSELEPLPGVEIPGHSQEDDS